MKKHYLQILSLFLLVPASITRAQVTKTLNGTVRYESGKSTSTFETPKGNVSVVLPQSLCGATITGTVSVEPSGKTEKEKNRNLKDLLQYVVMLDGQKIPLSASQANFDWLTHMDRQSRTPVELYHVSGYKAAELSLPPVLKAPATGVWQSDRTPLLTTPSNVLVKGDALSVYTDQQFSPGEKFVLTDSKGQQFTVKPVCLSANQAVITVPAEAVLGELTIREEVWNQPVSKFDVSQAHVNMIDINLTSPNTNLRPGELSNVQVICNVSKSDGQIYSWDHAYELFSIDLRNFNPNTVTMEGGNLQRVNVSSNKNDGIADTPAEQSYMTYQIRRNITGIKPGTFSVSATLHEDYNTSNDPFRPQLNVLQTPEDFNAWSNALKKDLAEYGRLQINATGGYAISTNSQRAIDLFPVCSNPEQLDECKAVAYSLVQPLQVPKGAAINWLSGYEASKTAAKASADNLASKTVLIDYDVLKNGVEFTKRIGESLKDAALQTESTDVLRLIDQIQTTTETKENLQNLKDKISALTAHVDTKAGTNIYSFYKYTMQDLVAATDLVSDKSPRTDSLRRFRDALITEISFPAIDAAEKDRTGMISLKYLPSYSTGSEKTTTPVQPKEKKWMPNNFSIEMEGLPCQKIDKINAFKFTTKITEDKLGDVRNYRILPGKIVIPDLKFSLPQSDIYPFIEWQSRFDKGNEFKKGSLDYTDAAGQPLFSFSIGKIKPIQINPAGNNTYEVVIRPEDAMFIYNPPNAWSDGAPIQFEQKPLDKPRRLEDKALQIGLHQGIKKLIGDAAGARGQEWNTVCDNCRGCIEARMGEWAAALIKELGVGIIKEYLGAAVDLIGEAVKAVEAAKEFFDKISDKVDNAEKLADDIAEKIKAGELQVLALEAKLCVKSSYCLIRGTIFYNPKTGCVFAIIYCEGTKLCCPEAQTIVTMTYCTNEDGMPTQVPDIEVIKK